MYEGYKGQRQACPDAVKEAVPRLQHLLKAMGVPVISVSGGVGGWVGGRQAAPVCLVMRLHRGLTGALVQCIEH